MASSNQRELCRYFMNGVCRFGSNCFNSHDRNDRPSNVCRYYLLGTCSYGSGCRYEHTRPKTSQQQPAPSPPQPQSQPPTPTTSSTSITTTTTSSSTRLNRPLIDDLPSNMVVLSKRKSNESTQLQTADPNDQKQQTPSKSSSNEIDLSKRPGSFIEALTGVKSPQQPSTDYEQPQEINYQQLCPYHEKDGCCPFEGNCGYIHGELCDICGSQSLHPFDQEQRQKHQEECSKQMEKDMEEAFATQRSQDKQCGICMEIVWEHESLTDQRFGILENCNHIFCLSCIRKWRSSKSYENKIVKACPECRVKSDYVTPSRYWFEDENEKKRIIAEYKTKLGETHCKYFKRGNGTCPFGNKCFYMHQLPDGSIADLPSPSRRRRVNGNGIQEVISDLIRLRIDLENDDYELEEDDDDDDFDWDSELSYMSIFDVFDHYMDELDYSPW